MPYEAKIDMVYDLPNCPFCGKKQYINRIDLSTGDGLERAKTTFVMVCENGSCKGGVIQDQVFGLFNPETHRIHKKPAPKKKLIEA